MFPSRLRPLFTLAALATALLVAASAARAGDPVTVGKHEGWNDMTQVEILQVFKISGYRAIVVLPVETQGAELPEGDNTAGAVAKAKGDLTANFVKGLQSEVPKGMAVATGTAGGAGTLIVKTKLVKLTPGSQAARMFLGVAGQAAGAARVTMSGEIIDAGTKKVLFRFEQQRSSGAGAGGLIQTSNPYVRLLAQSTNEIGEDVGGALGKFK